MDADLVTYFNEHTPIRPSNKQCWPWCGPKHRRGYGQFHLHRQFHRAHRVSYEYFLGRIPKGLHVCHRCDNPNCVNPHHLFLGTASDNIRDSVRKGRHSSVLHGPPPPKRGDASRFAKLTEKQVRSLVREWWKGARPKDLATRYGITHQYVYLLLQGKKWPNLQIQWPGRGSRLPRRA